MKLISKPLRMARVNERSHTFIHEWNEPSCLYFQPLSITALWLVLISRSTEGIVSQQLNVSISWFSAIFRLSALCCKRILVSATINVVPNSEFGWFFCCFRHCTSTCCQSSWMDGCQTNICSVAAGLQEPAKTYLFRRCYDTVWP